MDRATVDALRKAVEALERMPQDPEPADRLVTLRRACLVVADALLAELDPRTADRAGRPHGPPIAVTTRVHAVRYRADWLRGFDGALRVFADTPDQASASARELLGAAAARRRTAGMAHAWEILGVEEERR